MQDIGSERVFVNNNNNNKKEGGGRVGACVPTTDSQVAIERDGDVVPELFSCSHQQRCRLQPIGQEGDAASLFTLINIHVVT